jgi:hypothetical protein
MKNLFKQTRVIYDAHQEQYQVYYKNFLFWRFECSYRFDNSKSPYKTHYCTQKEAEERAIARAKAMLETVEVYRGSVPIYWC